MTHNIRYFVEAESGYFEVSAPANQDRDRFLNDFSDVLGNILDLERQGAVAFPPPKTAPVYQPTYESDIPGVFTDPPFKVEVTDPKIKPGYQGWPVLADQATYNAGTQNLEFWNLSTKLDGSRIFEHAIFKAKAWAVRQVMGLEDGYPLEELDWRGRWVFAWEVGKGTYDPRPNDPEPTPKDKYRHYNDLTGLWREKDYLVKAGTLTREEADPAPDTLGYQPTPEEVGAGTDVVTARVKYISDQVGPAKAEGVPDMYIPDANSLNTIKELKKAYVQLNNNRAKWHRGELPPPDEDEQQAA